MPPIEEMVPFGDAFVSVLQIVTVNEEVTREWPLYAF